MLADNYKFGMMVTSADEGDDASLAVCLCHEALLRSYFTLHSLY